MAWPAIVVRLFSGGARAAPRLTAKQQAQQRRASAAIEIGSMIVGSAGRAQQFRIRIVDQDNFKLALQQLIEKGANLQPVFAEVGSYIQHVAERNFESESGPDGGQWAPLAASTLNRRGSGARILRDRGHLYASLTYRADRNQVEVGTNRIYARIHQFGGQAGRGRKVTIPSRPYLGLNAGNRREIGGIFSQHLFEHMRR